MFFNKKNKVRNNSMVDGVDLITYTQPNSVIAEQFRTIRTNIQFSQADSLLKAVVVTSSGEKEGKSTFSANLAVTWAMQGVSTLLVDADLRRPTVATTFGTDNNIGLTTLLSVNAGSDLTNLIKDTAINNLFVLPSGPIPPNPSELINSNKMDAVIKGLEKNFDFIIFDTPPLNYVTDSAILATKVDGTILVVPENIATKVGVIGAVDALNKVHARILGSVMNRVINKDASTYMGYGYHY